MPLAFIGLGSNLANPVLQICQSIAELKAIPAARNVYASSLYRSAPMGDSHQPFYINAVVKIEVTIPPYLLLHKLQGIELAHGRKRGPQQWGPRTLDLDLLLYSKLCLDTPDLCLPHPGITKRMFVLLPLYELVPGLEIPGKGLVRDLLCQCQDKKIERLRTKHNCSWM